MASWVRGKCIGKGAFGIVNLAKRDGHVFAVKSVDLQTGLPAQVEALESEIRILRNISSPHVVAFLGDDVTCEGTATSSFRNLHLEYMPGGTVADVEFAHVDERLVRRYAWCLVNALHHIHERGIVHCDVKGRNVLVGAGDDGSVAKLADFGAAVEFSGGECSFPRGSPLWMAPEVIRREYQGPESDVWSLGCTVIEMVTRKPPWEDRGVDTLNRIGFSDELPEFPKVLSELGRDFIEKCLRRDRNRRWSCDQLLQHPFLLPNKVLESSPRCVLDWVDSLFTKSENDSEEEEEQEEETIFKINKNSVKNRIGKLVTDSRANWETEGWLMVRAMAYDAEEATEKEAGVCDGKEGGVSWEFRNVVTGEEGMELGTRLEYSESGSSNERVNVEMWKFNEAKRLVWRREYDDQCNRNRNRKDSIIVGGGYGWNRRYKYGLEKFISIDSLYCKIFNLYYYLFSITYYPFRLFMWLAFYCVLKKLKKILKVIAIEGHKV